MTYRSVYHLQLSAFHFVLVLFQSNTAQRHQQLGSSAHYWVCLEFPLLGKYSRIRRLEDERKLDSISR